MTDMMRQIIECKRAPRKELAALPVGETLGILEGRIEATRAIASARPAKPSNPAQLAPKTIGS